MSRIDPATLFAWGETVLPRFRHVGDLTLDLLHHDGRVEDRWLALQPHEFDILWRWAREPHRCLSEAALPARPRERAGACAPTEPLLAKLRSFRLIDILACRDPDCPCLTDPA